MDGYCHLVHILEIKCTIRRLKTGLSQSSNQSARWFDWQPHKCKLVHRKQKPADYWSCCNYAYWTIMVFLPEALFLEPQLYNRTIYVKLEELHCCPTFSLTEFVSSCQRLVNLLLYELWLTQQPQQRQLSLQQALKHAHPNHHNMHHLHDRSIPSALKHIFHWILIFEFVIKKNINHSCTMHNVQKL